MPDRMATDLRLNVWGLQFAFQIFKTQRRAPGRSVQLGRKSKRYGFPLSGSSLASRSTSTPSTGVVRASADALTRKQMYSEIIKAGVR